jgi:hypothetical protein
MKLRKINAVLSLATTVLLLAHAITTAIWMLSMGKIIPMGGHTLPRALMWVTIAHALVSIILMILAHQDKNTKKGNIYPKMNMPTMIQRITGVLLISFTFLHVASAMGVITPPRGAHAIVPPVFFLLTMGHIAVSGSKAFITLGIGSARFIKGVDICVKAICVITVIADIVGFYLHVC